MIDYLEGGRRDAQNAGNNFKVQNDPKQFLTSIFVVSESSASILLIKSELP